MLSLRDVHVHIGKLHILQGVNLDVKEGECAACSAAMASARPRHCAASWGWWRAAAVSSNSAATILRKAHLT